MFDQVKIKLFKEVFPLCIDPILYVINICLVNGHVPQTFKVVLVKPLLKKMYLYQ